MATQGYGIFVRLLKQGHEPAQMGLKGRAGDVSRWSSRYKLARNFRGLHVDEFSASTLKGYSAFFQVFLTHSALERYLPLVGLSEDALEAEFLAHRPEDVVQKFFALDGEGNLFEFLHKHLKHKGKLKLSECRSGACHNVFHLSSSIRHIFAHGHLTATASDIKPARVAKACELVSNYLLDYMEWDFTRRLREYAESIRPVPPG